ncbi:CAAX prenyl protease [Cryptosporidium xiaoi]|uniref:CAAX prenyl protease n=1 Tax=Cryptosporidium xiaoi TaxID=659607 RepID=A0AAV9Y1Q7_9CRYT
MFFDNYLLRGIFLINLIKYIVYLYIDLRQKKCYKLKELPKHVVDAYKDCGEVSNDEFNKSQSYNNDKMVYGLIKKAVGFIFDWVIVAYFIYPKIWNYVYVNISSNEYVSSLIFSGIIMSLDYPINILFDLYYTFVLEEKHGFNNSTARIFIVDQLKSIILISIMGSILLSAIIYVANNTGKYFYVYIAIVQFVFMLAIIIIHPIIIVPLFNKLTPVANEELAGKINNLCNEVNFPLKNLYQMDASLRSNHGNAFFTGIFNSKSIVLYDTIMDFPQDEIIAIVGHELGHWRNWDNFKMLLFTLLQSLAVLYLFHLTYTWDDLYLSFGFSLDPKYGGRKLITSLLVFSFVQHPISPIIGICRSIMSQYNEYKADEFSFNLGFGDSLARSLFRLSKKSSGCMIFDPIYSFIHLSHPSVCDRILNIRKLKTKGQ